MTIHKGRGFACINYPIGMNLGGERGQIGGGVVHPVGPVPLRIHVGFLQPAAIPGAILARQQTAAEG